MSHERNILTLMTAAFSVLLGCSSLEKPNARDHRQVGDKNAASLGQVEHRGRRHDLRDLMDPTYRAANKDDFARNFHPQTAFATTSLERMNADTSATAAFIGKR